MKISRLPDRLDRMPMLKILVFFAAGIALADRYELPLWFLAGAFVVTGVLALSLRSSAAPAAMILTAGFAAAQFRAPRATVPRGVHTVYEVTVEGFPADRGLYAVADASVAAWRDPADGRWHASDARIRLYADSLAGLHAGERIRCRGAVRPFRGGAESYRRLMARRGYAGTLWIAERTLLERLPGRHAGLHRRAVERLSRLPMSAGAAAVVEAMAAGERRGVTPELRTAYSRSRVVAGDSMEFLKAAREKYDLIFLDPPYETELLETAIAHIARHDLLNVHGMMIAEHPVDKALPALSAPYRMGRTYRYGKIAVTIYHRDGDEGAQV